MQEVSWAITAVQKKLGFVLFYLLVLIIKLLLFLHFRFYSLPYPFSVPYPIPPPCIPVSMRMSSPPPHPIRPPDSLGSPFSWGLGESSLTEPKPSSPLLYVCWEPHISWCMLPGWWFNVWEISRVQANWDFWSSYRVNLLLSFFQLFPNSTTGISCFCPLVGYKYMQLNLSNSCWVFQSAVMIGPF